MAYLSFSDYKSYSLADISKDEYPPLELKASVLLDSITNSFYQQDDLDTDDDMFRKSQFKRALALQIDFMVETKCTSTADLVNNPRAVSETQSIGRTSISKNYNAGDNSNDGRSIYSLISDEVLNILRPTGLLYKGVGWRA